LAIDALKLVVIVSTSGRDIIKVSTHEDQATNASPTGTGQGRDRDRERGRNRIDGHPKCQVRAQLAGGDIASASEERKFRGNIVDNDD
jgi:hypothetical protein